MTFDRRSLFGGILGAGAAAVLPKALAEAKLTDPHPIVAGVLEELYIAGQRLWSRKLDAPNEAFLYSLRLPDSPRLCRKVVEAVQQAKFTPPVRLYRGYDGNVVFPITAPDMDHPDRPIVSQNVIFLTTEPPPADDPERPNVPGMRA